MLQISTIAIPVPEVADLIAPWREETFIGATQGMPPHITVLYPWYPTPVSEWDIDDLRSVVAEIRPFPVQLTHLDTFPNHALYFGIRDDAALIDLILRVISAYPDTPPYGGEFSEPIPHITIAHASSRGELREIRVEVEEAVCHKLPIEIMIQELVVMQQGDDLNWYNLAVLPLGG